jgi:formyl-CoA transferase
LTSRIEHRDALTEIIETWMSGFGTDQEVMDALEAARVPHGPALTPEAALTHPHFVERGVVRTVTDPLAGEVTIPAFPFRSSDALPDDSYQAPALGEHNHDVLTQLAGLDAETLAAYAEQGIIFAKDT